MSAPDYPNALLLKKHFTWDIFPRILLLFVGNNHTQYIASSAGLSFEPLFAPLREMTYILPIIFNQIYKQKEQL